MPIVSSVSDQAIHSFGFRFTEEPATTTARLDTIGLQNRTSTDYSFDGMRRNIVNGYLFQYTLAGRGAIRIAQQTSDLYPGQAFFIKLAGDYRYYLPDDSPHWKFVYMIVRGDEADQCWLQINRKYGSLLAIDPDSTLIRSMLNMYNLVKARQITDGFQSSQLAYQFLMECYRHFRFGAAQQDRWPNSIRQAVAMMQKRYAELNGLEDLCELTGLSKFHFVRLFHETTGYTTVQYLTKFRMQKAVQFLRQTDHSVEEIARLVGYSNSSYFCKVFKRMVGLSPLQFRSGKSISPVDHITF